MQYPYNLKDTDYTLVAISQYNRTNYEGSGINSNVIRSIGEPEINIP